MARVATKSREVLPKQKPRVTAASLADENLPVASTKRGRVATKSKEVVSKKNPIALAFDSMLDTIEKDYSLTSSSVSSFETRVSLGLLGLDIVLGGGIVPGWYTVYGPEQSCKSTGASTFMASALNTNVPIISYFDFEGSFSADYVANILKLQGVKYNVDELFGLRNPKTHQWEIQPKVRYYSEGVAEKFFDFVAKLERMLPDKVKMGDDWFLIYEDTKVNRKLVGDAFDKNYQKKTGRLRVPADDDALQALIIVDSYPAMLPEKQDVDDPNSAIGVQARMFSDQIKRVKGKLRAKRIAIVGINQLRLKPMVMFGSPEYEPGGEALKFFSDVRLKFTPRALSGVPEVKGKGYVEEEDSVTGEGTDEYRYIHVRAQKNKLSAPNLECWLRLWIKNADGEGMGFDPVWDTWRYLRETNQVSGKRNSMKIALKGKEESKKSITWMDFKTLIIGKIADKKAIFEKWGVKPFNVREYCKRQIGSGEGTSLYFMSKKAHIESEEEIMEEA